MLVEDSSRRAGLAGARETRFNPVVGVGGDPMLVTLLIALVLMGSSVAVHAAGVAAALYRLQARDVSSVRLWSSTWIFVRLAAWIVLLHVVEIAVWGVFYAAIDAMPGIRDSLYFSAVTYTTTGYGDFVLPAEWRLVGGVEALTGILMCGWSTGFFFATVNRLYEARPRASTRTA
jgi:hypothetical protein